MGGGDVVEPGPPRGGAQLTPIPDLHPVERDLLVRGQGDRPRESRNEYLFVVLSTVCGDPTSAVKLVSPPEKAAAGSVS